MARTCTNNLRVVFSPYVQHCPLEASEQKMEPKKKQYIKIKEIEPRILDFFGFWAQNFFGGLNQKSATISMCKIHIYIDSESFRQIR